MSSQFHSEGSVTLCFAVANDTRFCLTLRWEGQQLLCSSLQAATCSPALRPAQQLIYSLVGAVLLLEPGRSLPSSA
jgi:hypothetical protein